MIVAGKHRCINCMSKMNIMRKICIHCGLKQEEYCPAPYCLNPGTLLVNRYVIGGTLGKGNYGITYLAWDIVLDRRVAVKEYAPWEFVKKEVIRGINPKIRIENPEGFAEGIKCFEKEAKYLSRFTYLTNVPSVLDFFYANETAYIVMEYISGISLQVYVEKIGKMRENKMIAFLRPLLKSLDEIHKTGLLHRDINPSNLICEKGKRLVLIDFGSMQMRGTTQKKTIQFSKGYSPPEQYAADDSEGSWTDVYAVCAVIYFMLTGQPPEDAVLRKAKENFENDRMSGILGKYKKVIEKGLAVNPRDRYANIPQLEAALDRRK